MNLTVKDVAISVDGRRIAVGSERGIYLLDDGGKIYGVMKLTVKIMLLKLYRFLEMGSGSLQ